MKAVRAIVCIMFVISCVIFGLYVTNERMTKDKVPPEFACEEDEISVSVDAGEEELLQGVTAKDDKDGDLTGSVRIASMSHFIGKGKRTVKYIVFDQANNAAAFSRTVLYTDYRAPRIYLSKPLRFSVGEVMGADLTEYMTAEDCLDGDLSKQIRITRDTDYYDYDMEAGSRSITVQVSNSAGDVCLIPMVVDFISSDSKAEEGMYYPVLSQYIVYTSVGKELDLQSFLTGISNAGAEYSFESSDKESEDDAITAEDVKILSSIDYSAAGVYQVEYQYTSPEGVKAVTRLAVVVEE